MHIIGILMKVTINQQTTKIILFLSNTLINSHFVLSKKDLVGSVTEHQLLETQVSKPEIEKQ